MFNYNLSPIFSQAAINNKYKRMTMTTHTSQSFPLPVAFILGIEALTLVAFVFSILALTAGTSYPLRKDAAILTVSHVNATPIIKQSYSSMCYIDNGQSTSTS
jgi:hypothetical protein